ncbi:MAG TPA: dihydrodipicolinate synthase family protein [Saprospiraceae bacterium]|nr:dihydrodipicolinate synthase family protein [Saprospiraceae bacterium]
MINDGLIAATHTPMNINGDILYDVIPSYYQYLKQNKLIGIFLNGSTSEGYHLTTTERMSMVEAWSKAIGDDDFKLFVFTGHLSTKESCQLTEHAASFKNVYGISATAPFYQKPASQDLIIALCKEIAEKAAHKPFYYYHIPVLTQVNLPIAQFLVNAKKEIPNLQGVKYTHNDLEEYLVARNIENGNFEIFAGFDELSLANRSLGARKFIGSSYNFLAPLYYEMFERFDGGDFFQAQQLQLQSIQIIRILASYGYIAACKFIMAELGINNGYVRLPSKQISEKEKIVLMRDLEKTVFFNYTSLPTV